MRRSCERSTAISPSGECSRRSSLSVNGSSSSRVAPAGMRAPSGVRRTRSIVAARRSDASLVGTPVLLQVADQRGAEVTEGLLARVDAHVFAEDVERFLADSQG